MTQAKALQNFLDMPGILPMPGVFDPISTRIAERAGFKAAFMSGFNVAAARIGMPDTGLISYTEMLDQGRNLVDAVSIPIIGDGDIVRSFEEKPQGDGAIINGGFFVLSPSVIDLIDDDQTSWELEPLLKLVEDENLMVYRHDGFWQPMDTLRDKMVLQELWESNKAPWKIW